MLDQGQAGPYVNCSTGDNIEVVYLKLIIFNYSLG